MSEAQAGGAGARMRPRPRLRTILLIVNCLILILPLGGIAILRLYENELIRGTESQLIVQGAHVRDTFRAELLREAGASRGAGEPGSEPALGRPLPPAWRGRPFSPELPDVVLPRLDISHENVRPAEHDSAPSGVPADPIAAGAGARIMPALQESGRTTLTGIRVVDANGTVVATTRTEMGHSLSDREEVRRALAGEVVSLLRERTPDEPSPPLASLSRGQRYRVIVALPVIDRDRLLGAVLLARTPMDIQKALYLNRRPILFGAATLVGVVVVVSLLTAFTISRPVKRLIEQAERVSAGEKAAHVEVKEPGTYEVALLSEALARMARALERRADYIRTFASHVSHEFKTPLTTIRGTVELLRDHADDMKPQERERFLQILAESSARLDRLVRRLLELARADVQRPGEDVTLIGEALERTARRFREEGLNVELQQSSPLGGVRMAPEALEEIFSNLLDNARQHGGEGVRVRVVARLDRGDGPARVEVRFSNDGPGISKANAGRVFTPFFTTAREHGGTGLGLSIVRALAEAHGGAIELESAGAVGVTFLLRLPAVDASSSTRPLPQGR